MGAAVAEAAPAAAGGGGAGDHAALPPQHQRLAKQADGVGTAWLEVFRNCYWVPLLKPWVGICLNGRGCL